MDRGITAVASPRAHINGDPSASGTGVAHPTASTQGPILVTSRCEAEIERVPSTTEAATPAASSTVPHARDSRRIMDPWYDPSRERSLKVVHVPALLLRVRAA